MIEEEGSRLEQPEVFDLELELLRWVKQSCLEADPPLMQKPSGNVIQYYGLDSKSRYEGDIMFVAFITSYNNNNDTSPCSHHVKSCDIYLNLRKKNLIRRFIHREYSTSQVMRACIDVKKMYKEK